MMTNRAGALNAADAFGVNRPGRSCITDKHVIVSWMHIKHRDSYSRENVPEVKFANIKQQQDAEKIQLYYSTTQDEKYFNT